MYCDRIVTASYKRSGVIKIKGEIKECMYVEKLDCISF